MRCCLACCNAGRVREQNEYSPGHGRYVLGTASAAVPTRGLMPSFEDCMPALSSLTHCCAAHAPLQDDWVCGKWRWAALAACALPAGLPACISAGRRWHLLSIMEGQGHSGRLNACPWRSCCYAVKFIMFFVTMLITLIYWTFLGEPDGWLGVE